MVNSNILEKLLRIEIGLSLKMMFFWVYEPCGLVGRSQHVREVYCLCLEG
jgi:hypothetical protein